MTEKSVATKLMFKPGRRVRIVNPPENLTGLLGSVPDQVAFLQDDSGPAEIIQADVIVFFAHNSSELLALLPGIQTSLAPGGMIWIAYHKGTSPVKTDINRDSINALAHTMGLEGVAIISIDEDWSALRLKVA